VYLHTNYDQHGYCTEQDNGQDIPKGDGLIQQVEKHGDKTTYAIMTIKKIRDMIDRVSSKSESIDNNNYTLICNKIQYRDIQRILTEESQEKAPNGGWYYSMADVQKRGDNMTNLNMIKAGVTFSAYEFDGNILNIMPDTSLTEHFGNRGYGIIIDTTPNKAEGEPTLKKMTLKNNEFILNTRKGAGVTSGEVSNMSEVNEYSAISYAGAMLANPSVAHLLVQSIR
jgi:hypothetical protein